MIWAHQKYISSKQKRLWNKKYLLCLGNKSKNFKVDNMKKTGLNGCISNCFFDHKAFDICGITDIHKYLMKKYDIK